MFTFTATAIVVPCMTTMASQFGTVAQKGTVMGIFRSLGALARATGPVVASVCKYNFLKLSDLHDLKLIFDHITVYTRV